MHRLTVPHAARRRPAVSELRVLTDAASRIHGSYRWRSWARHQRQGCRPPHRREQNSVLSRTEVRSAESQLQIRMGCVQVQRTLWNLPALELSRPFADDPTQCDLKLGALSQHRICQGEGDGMTKSVWKRSASGRTVRRKNG